MKILIMGGHGFIGHNVASMLSLEHDITVIDCHHQYGEFSDTEFNTVLNERIKFMGDHKFYLGSVTDYEFVEKVFQESRPEVVIDLATYPNAKMVAKNVVDATENMITATAVALELCAKYEVRRFVIASSSMVYGNFDSNANETHPCNPLTLYGSYKLQCEQMCKIWGNSTGLEYVILRPSAVYGVRDMVVRVISKMTLSAIKHGHMIVQGQNSCLDFSYVTDVANAFAIAATEQKCKNGIFNCTPGKQYSILDAANIINSYIKADIIIQDADTFYPSRGALDSSKLQSVSSWQPMVGLEKGIENYINWFLPQPYIKHI